MISAPVTAGITWQLAYTQTVTVSGQGLVLALYYSPNSPAIANSVGTLCNASNYGGTFNDNGFLLAEGTGFPASVSVDAAVFGYGAAPTLISAGNIVTTQAADAVFVMAVAPNFNSQITVGSGYTMINMGGVGFNVGGLQYALNLTPGTYPTGWGNPSDSGNWLTIAVAFAYVPPPPPSFPCLPQTNGNIVDGVYLPDLQLYIAPASALYTQPVPSTAITYNESNAQGRTQIILDFNDSEGLYSRDFGTVFAWPISSGTILDIWQPSIVPMDDDVYERLSFHFLMKSLGLKGWGHIRELNFAYSSSTPLTLLLTFDQWPSITITIPSSSGSEIKQKIVVPPNKFKLVEGFLSSTQPFLLWTSDCELKLGEWGRTEGYRVLKPFS